jgi:hypothetical protein
MERGEAEVTTQAVAVDDHLGVGDPGGDQSAGLLVRGAVPRSGGEMAAVDHRLGNPVTRPKFPMHRKVPQKSYVSI